MWPYILRALPTPKTILAMRAEYELPHPVNNCISQRLSFQVSKSEFDRDACRSDSMKPKYTFSFYSYGHIGPPKCAHYRT